MLKTNQNLPLVATDAPMRMPVPLQADTVLAHSGSPVCHTQDVAKRTVEAVNG